MDTTKAVLDCLRLLELLYGEDVIHFPKDSSDFREFLYQVEHARVITYLAKWFNSKEQEQSRSGATSTLTNKLILYRCVTIISQKWYWNHDEIQNFINSDGNIELMNNNNEEEVGNYSNNSNSGGCHHVNNGYDLKTASIDCLILLKMKYGMTSIDKWPSSGKKFEEFLDNVKHGTSFYNWLQESRNVRTKHSTYSSLTNRFHQTMKCIDIEHQQWYWIKRKLEKYVYGTLTITKTTDPSPSRRGINNNFESKTTTKVNNNSKNNNESRMMNIQLIDNINRLNEIRSLPLFAVTKQKIIEPIPIIETGSTESITTTISEENSSQVGGTINDKIISSSLLQDQINDHNNNIDPSIDDNEYNNDHRGNSNAENSQGDGTTNDEIIISSYLQDQIANHNNNIETYIDDNEYNHDHRVSSDDEEQEEDFDVKQNEVVDIHDDDDDDDDEFSFVNSQSGTAGSIDNKSKSSHYLSDIDDDNNNLLFVAIDCEGIDNKNLCLIQIGTNDCIYIFDCVKVDPIIIGEVLQNLFNNHKIIKMFHDVHHDVVALTNITKIQHFVNILDTQLVMEALTGSTMIGFNAMLEHFDVKPNPYKEQMHIRMRNNSGSTLFTTRPLQHDIIQYAAFDVSLLLDAKDMLIDKIGDLFDNVQQASDIRVMNAIQNDGRRILGFDTFNNYVVSSPELLKILRPESLLESSPLQISNDTQILLDLLPTDLISDIIDKTDDLIEIAIDKGRPAIAWIGTQRIVLGSSDNETKRIIDSYDIEHIVNSIGYFGSDNRAGIEHQLHRISALRNRNNDIIGLTMRVGRHVTGNATIISDLLLSNNDKPISILFLGEPGTGKTTVVREATRIIADQYNTCIVDTSNEIAGDGDIPHPCVGLARRMMVPSLAKQAAVMIECIQNHTPQVMVIDEIGRSEEVDTARTCKNRGVRMIASAHGDFRKLIKNQNLRGLVGGIQTVTLGDAQAKIESQRFTKNKGRNGGIDDEISSSLLMNKLKPQRAGEPVFDVIVELRRGTHHEYRIIMNVADAVDKVLDGCKYQCVVRTRDPISGQLYIKYEQC